MPTKYFLFLLACAVSFTGCGQYGILVKRESELNCPTDIRKTVPWCAGQDAIFRCPCGPNEQFHGHKPTCWRPWQTSGAEWRDLHCDSNCSQCETEFSGSLPLEQPRQPIEVWSPTKALPATSLDGSGSREEAVPSNPFPVEEEFLPQPDAIDPQLDNSSDTQSSESPKRLPWQGKSSEGPTRSLTSYFHQLRKKSDRKTEELSDTNAIVQMESVTQVQSIATNLPEQPRLSPEQPKLLPPTDEEVNDVLQRTAPATVALTQPQLIKLPTPIEKPMEQPQVNLNVQRAEQSALLSMKVNPAEPKENVTELAIANMDSAVEFLSNETAIRTTAFNDNQVNRSASLNEQNVVPTDKEAIPSQTAKSQLSIVIPAVQEPMEVSPIKLKTQMAPTQPPKFKNIASPRMPFVR